MIRLTVKKIEKNPAYEEKMAEYKEASTNRYWNRDVPDYPQFFIERDTLQVEINEEQYEAIRKAVLEQF